MKLKFDSTLEYQLDAINSLVKIFEGQPIASQNFELTPDAGSGLCLTDHGIGNQILLTDDQILANVKKIQTANNIEAGDVLQGRDFSVEMETGTGKTYVYLRSIFELSKTYGLKKFIIVVPNVAIREGVLKSIEITMEHFRSLYENEPFDFFVYDSKKLGRIRQFSASNHIQIMVINIQSFSKDISDKDISEMTDAELKKLNIINRENDRMSGFKPIEFIQASNPVVIIDEPQSVDNTPKAKLAISNLNPIFTLRFSATHRNPYNLIYKLDPIRAYDLRLVKRIEVSSVQSDDTNDAFVKLLKTDGTDGIRAQVEIFEEKKGSVKPKITWLKTGDDLYSKSGKREIYSDGYIVQNIDCTENFERIEFSSGKTITVGSTLGSLGEDIMKAQVEETIAQHLKKEKSLNGGGIKVLSLFFLDRVADYRVYNEDGTIELGPIGKSFEEAYLKLTKKELFAEFSPENLNHDIVKMHNGYFSQDRSGKWKDSTERGNADDSDTYNLIMRDKEKLLDPREPLRFIFSHSALREGWDNPNVFQICTLNKATGAEKKRQVIGRGLRLPVNLNGDRVQDENINRLTVIANESYETFAKSLQNEFEKDFGIRFGRIEKICFANILREVDGSESVIGQDESLAIWNELVKAGYINMYGEIQSSYDPSNLHFELAIDEKYNDIKPLIIDEMNRYVFENRVVDVRRQKKLEINKQVQLSPEFQDLWDKIKHRTKYSVRFDSEELITKASMRLKSMERVTQNKISIDRVEVDIAKAGIGTDKKLESREQTVERVPTIPNILQYLQKRTELTRRTLLRILRESERLADFLKNPQQFMDLATREIVRTLHEVVLSGIQYKKIDDHYWEMSRIEEEAEKGIVRYLDNCLEVQNKEKTLFDAIEYDSEVEKRFALDLDNNEYVRLFVKLPRWFVVDTPVGPYNPDWAFVTERDRKLYFVRETKGTKDFENLRKLENQKIHFGKRHFEAIDVDYDVVTKLSEVKF